MDDPRSDDELVEAAIKDVDAFALLYRRHLHRIYVYLRSKVASVAEAEDVTSQTFIAALENIEHYHPGGNFRAWLTQIAHHKCMDYFRKNRRIISFEQIEILSTLDEPIEYLVHQRLQIEDVQSALSRLNPERAEALRLRVFGDLSHAEIAAIIGKSEGATKNLVWRAMNDLKQYFSAEEACANE